MRVNWRVWNRQWRIKLGSVFGIFSKHNHGLWKLSSFYILNVCPSLASSCCQHPARVSGLALVMEGDSLLSLLGRQAGWQGRLDGAGQDRTEQLGQAGQARPVILTQLIQLDSLWSPFHETLCFLLKNPSQVLMSTDVLNLVWVYLFQKKQKQPWSTVFQRREHNCKMNDHIWATVFGYTCISFWCHFVDILQQPLILQTKSPMS